MAVQALEHTRLSGSVAVAALVGEIGNWEGVEVAQEPRFGGPMFQLGRRQLGHLHDAGERGTLADIPLLASPAEPLPFDPALKVRAPSGRPVRRSSFTRRSASPHRRDHPAPLGRRARLMSAFSEAELA